MTQFNVHSIETAPADSVPLLEGAKRSLGFVPNLFGVFAESPATLEGYMALGKIFDKTSLSATERQVVILAASRYNECHYCIAAHSVIAGMQNVPRDVVEAIRNDRPVEDAKLEALRRFTTAVVDKRGWVGEDDVAAFENAGYGKQQVLEVILGTAFKTISNYSNHVANTPLDGAFESQAWKS